MKKLELVQASHCINSPLFCEELLELYISICGPLDQNLVRVVMFSIFRV